MGHSGLFSRNAIKKRYSERQKEKGLCISCSKKAKKPHIRCSYHLRKQKEYNKKFYEKNSERMKEDQRFHYQKLKKKRIWKK